MSSDGAQQANVGSRVFFKTQAGGCAHNACGAVRPTQKSEVASPSAPLSSQPKALPSRSLRSARWQQDSRSMQAISGHTARHDWLHVRVTAEEADHVTRLADMRGLTVSDYVRKAALRGSGRRHSTRRRVLSTDAAGTIRELSAIARDMRRLLALAELNRTIPRDKLQACVTAVHDAISGFAA
jgi:uncharacterized protein (DUF1778 family)